MNSVRTPVYRAAIGGALCFSVAPGTKVAAAATSIRHFLPVIASGKKWDSAYILATAITVHQFMILRAELLQ